MGTVDKSPAKAPATRQVLQKNKQCTTFKCQVGNCGNGSCKTNIKDCRAKGVSKQEQQQQQQSDKKAEEEKKKKIITYEQLSVTRRRHVARYLLEKTGFVNALDAASSGEDE